MSNRNRNVVVAAIAAVVALAAVAAVVVSRGAVVAVTDVAAAPAVAPTATTTVVVQGVRKYAVSLDVRQVFEDVVGKDAVHQRHVGRNVGTWDIDRSAAELASLLRSTHVTAKGRRLVFDSTNESQVNLHLEE